MESDPLTDFAPCDLTLNEITKCVYQAGKGPAVIVMAEMPGITPQVARFARWVRDAGFTVWMPSLFGQDGAVAEADYGAHVFKKTCISAEFQTLAGQGSSPVTDWLRALARHVHKECGGPGVGAIGMCFTGNFALSMMLEPAMLAPVLAQPSLPFDDRATLESSPEELRAVRQRLEAEDLTVLAYRFQGDRICKASRFEAYRAALGERFLGRELPDEAANPDPPPFSRVHVRCPHSVFTADLVDREGAPTLAARDEVLDFFAQRLRLAKADPDGMAPI